MTRVTRLVLAGLGVVGAGVVQVAGAATATGESTYQSSCVACHGADGGGVLPGVPDFTATDGPLAVADEVLVKRIAEGFQSPGSPMAMPPRGGNPGLRDEDIRAVVRYMRQEFGVR
ncbi:c-type cytochrome [Candidatus Accumulibacter aalborgensis]|nr:cytochrome c [Candidatus Accumulibacter aalborgensis]